MNRPPVVIRFPTRRSAIFVCAERDDAWLVTVARTAGCSDH